MSLSQRLSLFEFDLVSLDLASKNKTNDQLVQIFASFGFNSQLVQFMLNQRMLLNRVLLRLQLYSETNMSESDVRSGLSMLNNPSVTSLVDYLFNSTSTSTSIESNVTTKKSSPQQTPVVTIATTVAIVEEDTEQVEDDNEEECEESEESHFDSYFNTCVRESDDPTNVVKLKEMYESFTKWWNNIYEDELPSKDDLKDYLASRLGRKVGSTVTNVMLV
jgi:hypothetical protein